MIAYQARIIEPLSITSKLPSGYQRDLQRLKAPLFRGIDLAIESVDIMAHLFNGMRFIPENISLDPGVYAAEEAYRLVRDEAHVTATYSGRPPSSARNRFSRSRRRWRISGSR